MKKVLAALLSVNTMQLANDDPKDRPNEKEKPSATPISKLSPMDELR